MECKVSELVKRGHDQAVELKSSCGAVDVRDVAQLISDLASQLDVQRVRVEESQREFRAADATIENLQMQVEKLAAESEGLKDEISNITFMRDDDFFGSTQRAQEVMGRLVNAKTPATDAFLAEVRAQGVEMFASVLQSRGRHQDYVEIANAYAAQLRKGVQP